MRAVLVIAFVLGSAGLAGCGGGGSTAGRGGTATAASRPSPRAQQPSASARDPWTHLQALATVATRNRGTRAAATPGGVATEQLIADRLRAAGFTVRFEDVRFPFFDERRPPVVELPGGRRLGASRDVRHPAAPARVRAPGGRRAGREPRRAHARVLRRRRRARGGAGRRRRARRRRLPRRRLERLSPRADRPPAPRRLAVPG